MKDARTDNKTGDVTIKIELNAGRDRLRAKITSLGISEVFDNVSYCIETDAQGAS